VNNQDMKALERLLKAHRDVANHLAKRASEDQAYDVGGFLLISLHRLY
jgi:cohesin loading factor subunit SCC2